MKIWKNIQNCHKKDICFVAVCVICTVLLFLVMKSETMFTDAGFCAITVVIAARSYRKQKALQKLLSGQIMLESYLEKVRYELSGSNGGAVLWGGMAVEAFAPAAASKGFYYRAFCTLKDVYSKLGCQDNSVIAEAIGSLQEAVIKEHDLQQNIRRELSGLKWIILSAVPALPLVRAWVTANISDMEIFYKGEAGILLKYGIWVFSLFVFMLFDRLGEIKSEKYT